MFLFCWYDEYRYAVDYIYGMNSIVSNSNIRQYFDKKI